jgi:hypothetical protein
MKEVRKNIGIDFLSIVLYKTHQPGRPIQIKAKLIAEKE